MCIFVLFVATEGLVQQGFCNSGAESYRFNFCTTIELWCNHQLTCFDCPTIAKPRTVGGNANGRQC
ncbi:MAG: hypothetical protein LC111_11150, partial [Bacteroidia bacterium]|nr:hypothetical protein [Bacteroidia bacterium]